MSLFCNRRPRPFCHRMIYTDERSERLEAIEKRARRELGTIPPDGDAADTLHGEFTGRLRHGRRSTAFSGTSALPLRVVLLVAVLLACLYFLVAGM